MAQEQREQAVDDGPATGVRPSFGEALRERRRGNGISVRALATQVGGLEQFLLDNTRIQATPLLPPISTTTTGGGTGGTGSGRR